MGYRSDVVIAFAFETREQVDEVMAIYRMHPQVQKYDLAKDWRIFDWKECWGLTMTALNVKWYEVYEDVQGHKHMLTVVEQFAEERMGPSDETDDDGKPLLASMFRYAYYKIRIGEEDNDIETTSDDNSSTLLDCLFDRMCLRREIETNF